ncbi:MAG: CYTH domain-containing protein [Bacteroidales bacterium]|nr:CYTH domain-containing protein [Bacteroidales bacterium]
MNDKERNYTEIEKKFLVTGNFKNSIKSSHKIIQGYLSHDPARSVRIRVIDESGFINVKGETIHGGISRFEWEKEIPKEDAHRLLGLSKGFIVEKTRHLIDYKGYLFEIDEFQGENAGLVVAEIELSSEDEKFDKPEWLGREVSHDTRYYNLELSVNPFTHW